MPERMTPEVREQLVALAHESVFAFALFLKQQRANTLFRNFRRFMALQNFMSDSDLFYDENKLNILNRTCYYDLILTIPPKHPMRRRLVNYLMSFRTIILILRNTCSNLNNMHMSTVTENLDWHERCFHGLFAYYPDLG